MTTAARRSPTHDAADTGSDAHGPITYDAKDPDTKYPPINQLGPPKSARYILIVPIDDASKVAQLFRAACGALSLVCHSSGAV